MQTLKDLIRQRAARLAIWLALIAAWSPHCRAADAIVVCPRDFLPAIDVWVRYRSAQGIECKIIQPRSTATATKQGIVNAASSETKYLLIVGDAPVIGSPIQLSRQVPMHYVPTTETTKWFSTASLATDCQYADLDGDHVAELAVGRLPVDDPHQLRAAIKKMIAYEQSSDFGPWRNEVQLVGGVGGFGFVVDTAIETVTRTVLTNVLPPETRPRIRFASPGHAFYPSHGDFTQTVLDDFHRGARFWVYAGHGQVTHLDHVLQRSSSSSSDDRFRPRAVLDQASAKRLAAPQQRLPIALILACYTGAMDASEDSIAEQMWLGRQGPIAVIAGSRVTMPYGNAVAAVGLIDRVYQQRSERLGDAWLGTVQSMCELADGQTSVTRTMIDTMAHLVSPSGADLTEERREHSQLYNLIGDPMLKLRPGRSVEIDTARGHEPGQPIKVAIRSPLSGTLTLTVDRPLGAKVAGDPNELTSAQIETTIDAGQTMDHQLILPRQLTGPIIIRVHVAGAGDWASSAVRTIVRPESHPKPTR